MSSITVRHDLRGQFGPARDQEGRETCLAFAMSDAHAAARADADGSAGVADRYAGAAGRIQHRFVAFRLCRALQRDESHYF